jgi:hypothetical protein
VTAIETDAFREILQSNRASVTIFGRDFPKQPYSSGFAFTSGGPELT